MDAKLDTKFLKRNVAGLLASGAIRYTNFEYLGRNRGLLKQVTIPRKGNASGQWLFMNSR